LFDIFSEIADGSGPKVNFKYAITFDALAVDGHSKNGHPLIIPNALKLVTI